MKKHYVITSFLAVLFLLLMSFSEKSKVISNGAKVQKLADGFKFTEGPATAPNGDIYFTDQPNNQILKWEVQTDSLSVFLTPAGRSNGMYFDDQGFLITCADAHNQMWRIDMTGAHTVLINDFDGALFNAPNDLWIDEVGGVYFTDPLYKRPYWTRGAPYLDQENVYYRAPNGKITTVIDDFVKPNGIIGDRKNHKLFVSDIKDNKIWAYDISSPGVLSHKTLFTAMGSDGMTIDRKRNIYLTNTKGVYVFNAEGEQIELIEVPENWTANVTIGGKKNKTLYITSVKGFYSIELKVKGL